MIKKLLGLCVIALTLTACPSGDNPATEGSETITTDNGSEVPAGSDWATFEAADMPIRMKVPDTDPQTVQLVQKTIAPYEQTVHCAGLKVVVQEALGDDIMILKEDLANDGLYKCTILKDEDGLVIYKQETPDASEEMKASHVFHHFVFVKNIGNIDYLVRSIISSEEYSEKAIMNMVMFAKTLEATPAV